jgi:hypothetical protein
LSGAPLHLDCALPTGRHGGNAGGGCNSVDNRVGLDHVQWRFAASRTSTYNSQYQLSEQPGSTDYRTLDTESPGSEFILTRDGGLITLGARLEQSGSYTCSIGGATVVRHDVTVLRKQRHDTCSTSYLTTHEKATTVIGSNLGNFCSMTSTVRISSAKC